MVQEWYNYLARSTIELRNTEPTWSLRVLMRARFGQMTTAQAHRYFVVRK
jgi:hypothetical protein